MIDVSVDLGFLKLHNPVIAASGTFGYGLEFSQALDLNRLGGFVVKGLYFSPRQGNPPPRLAETSCGLINSIGLPGIGVKQFSHEILPKLTGLQTAVIINICGENREEYASVADYLDKHEEISAYELNISCPNVKKGGICPAQNPEDTYETVKLVKNSCSTPVITKLSPNVTDISEIALSAQEGGSDALSLVNTFLAMDIDAVTRKPKLGNIMGGLSGPAIKPIALRMVYQAVRAVKIPVIGMGGIQTGRDAVEYLIAGARAVQVGTANFISPDATLQIIDEINAFCEDNHIKKVEDLIRTLDIDS
ncbi:MAG: dihydroorotate dehydrogenase [Candidatus Aminicenantes bacterium]|nr:dihydroorotate dehydrogenase [Candidatus Aminicenantes bacterium]